MSAEREPVYGVDDDIALQVIVRAEYLDGTCEAVDVDVVIHDQVTNRWAVELLRRIAADLELEPESEDAGEDDRG